VEVSARDAQEVSNAPRVSVTEKLSHRDALTKVKSDSVLQQTLCVTVEVVDNRAVKLRKD